MKISPELKGLIASLEQQAKADSQNVLAVGVAIVQDGKLLIVTRAPEEDVFPNHQEIPGGGVEKHESLLEALAREMREETSLEIASVIAYLGTMDFQGVSGDMIRQFNFLVEPTHYQVRLNPFEHSALEWLPLDQPEILQDRKMTDLMRKTILEFLPLL